MGEPDRVARVIDGFGAMDATEMSMLMTAIRAPGRRIAASIVSASALVWSDMEALGWLREAPSAGSRYLTPPVPTTNFIVTALGRAEIPRALGHRRSTR